MIAEGRYKAVAVPFDGKYVEFGKSKAGNEQCAVTFEITEGDDKGTRLPWWGSFSRNAMEYTIRGLRAMGFEGDDLSTIHRQRLDNEVVVQVEHNSFTGRNGEQRTSARVVWVYDPRGAQRARFAEALEGNELADFAARMRSALAGDGAPPRAKPDDDVPF